MVLDFIKVERSSVCNSSHADNIFELSDEYVRQLNSPIPVSIIDKELIRKQAEDFVTLFPGKVMYAVKCNPDEEVLKSLYAGGVKCFDAASLYEIELIRKLFPKATIYFMHPIKAPEAIFSAYHTYNVNAFVLDYQGELDKIIQVLPEAKDLNLYLRIAVPKGNVATDFSTKFGAKFDESVTLLRECRKKCKFLGVSFHVGTQCTDPTVYDAAIRYAKSVLKESGVTIESLDIGGGFPADLDINQSIPPLKNYMSVISNALKDTGLNDIELLCEAGRGLVANGGALVVRIEGRKNNILYINDGVYGGLFEAGGSIGLPYPARLIKNKECSGNTQLAPFSLAGPTCDSVDMMNGPFMLPNDAQVGDWILLDKLGAYGEVSRTNFNGFGKVQKLLLTTPNP